MNDRPYSLLKQDANAYEILLLRDQQELPFSAIAKRFGLSISGARQRYYRLKDKQNALYIQHIAAALGV